MPNETADAARRRVVLTGAAGRIGVAVAGPLAQRWDLWRADQDDLEADLPTGVDGFVVAHGVSANRHGVAELEETRRAIGYAPTDDAWDEDAG